MHPLLASTALSFALAGCLATSESPEPDDTSAPLALTHTDSTDPPEPSAKDDTAPREQIGEAAEEDAVGAIFGAIGGGVAGTVLGGFVFGPWAALVLGLGGSAVAGYYGNAASGDRPPWPGGPPQQNPFGTPGGDR